MVTESVDPERLALSWCFINTDLKPLIVDGLALEDFIDPEHQQVFAWALEHYSKYTASPGVDALRLRWPTWRLVDPTDHIDVYLKDIRDRKRYNILRTTAQQIAALTDADKDDEAAALLRQTAADLTYFEFTTHDEDITLNTQERYEYYDMLRETPGALRGMATGFHTIDRATGGVQPSQFIVIGGFAKSGKSTCLMIIGKNFWRQGKRGLLVSFEMSAAEQKSRWDAINAKVNYRKLLDGRTSIVEMNKVRQAMKKMEGWYPFILSTDIAHVTTVAGIVAKVEQHDPDFVLVDGIYLMMDDYGEDPGSPQAITNITRDFKRLAQRTTVPIIGTTQASEAKTTRKRGITTGAFSWSQSFAQDCNALIGLQPADDEEETAAEIRVLESREGPKVRAELIWDWETMEFEERWGDDYADDGAAPQSTGGY